MAIRENNCFDKFLNVVTKDIARSYIISNECYIGKISEDLRVKIKFRYENWTCYPAVGLELSIINLAHGEIDSHFFHFGEIFGTDYKTHDYWICAETRGWYQRTPSDKAIQAFVKDVDEVVSMYREQYY